MVTKEALPIDSLVGAYDLGIWESVQPLPGGKSQHYHIVTRRGGEYVLRRSYRSKTLEGIRFEHELIAHLRRNGFPAPAVVPAVDGRTYLVADGRLHAVSVFVKGSRYQEGSLRHLQAVARSLATYHRLVASFRPSAPTPRGSFLNESLRKRLTAMPSPEALANILATDGDRRQQLQHLLVSLPYALEQSEAALAVLDRCYPKLPLLIIHGGCRRGSAFFAGDSLIAMLDFDSARLEARAVDLAVALHDLAKVYGDPASPEYKVPLDLEVVSAFLDAHQQVNRLEPAEIEALPALLTAKRLKRAFGRYQRLFKGEELSEGDVKKIALELARVRWLGAHKQELQAALSGAAQRTHK